MPNNGATNADWGDYVNDLLGAQQDCKDRVDGLRRWLEERQKKSPES